MQQLNSRARFVKLKHEGLNQISHRMLVFMLGRNNTQAPVVRIGSTQSSPRTENP